MSGNSGGCGAFIGMASLILMLALMLSTCTGGGGHFTDGGKSGNNPYQPGTTNFERYERVFN